MTPYFVKKHLNKHSHPPHFQKNLIFHENSILSLDELEVERKGLGLEKDVSPRLINVRKSPWYLTVLTAEQITRILFRGLLWTVYMYIYIQYMFIIYIYINVYIFNIYVYTKAWTFVDHFYITVYFIYIYISILKVKVSYEYFDITFFGEKNRGH